MTHKMEPTRVHSILHLPDEALIKLQTVLAQFDGVSKSKWYAGIKSGEYPRPVKVGGSSRWVVGEIRQILKNLQSKPR